MIRRKPLYVPVASVVAPRFVVLPSPRSRRLIEAFGVATVVHPFVLVSSVASASVGSDDLASTRTTKTSTRATSEKGKGASVMRTVRSPLPVPDESVHAAAPNVPRARAANSRSDCVILVISCTSAVLVLVDGSRAQHGPIFVDSDSTSVSHSSSRKRRVRARPKKNRDGVKPSRFLSYV